MIPIDEPGDPRIAAYRDIRERDRLGRDGLFVAESVGVVRTLLTESRFAPVSVLLSEAQARNKPDLLALAAAKNAPAYVAAQSVLDQVAGFPLHRGVIALGRCGATPRPATLLADLPDARTVLVIVGASDADNVGALFRNAAAFGAEAVILNGAACDPLYRKAIRVSVGAVLRVPFARGGDARAVISEVAAAGLDPIALAPRAAVALSTWTPPKRLALVVGPEGPGLPPDVLAVCTGVGIEMAPGVDSLNVATAAAVALHRVFTHRNGASDADAVRARSGEA